MKPLDIVRFGRYEFDLQRGELRRSGLRLRLRPQASSLLALLIRRSGHIVSREEIQKHLWPEGTFVDYEGGINHAVRQIRTALGDDAGSGRFIETVPRAGYRFSAGVEPVTGNGTATAKAEIPRDRLRSSRWGSRIMLAALGVTVVLAGALTIVDTGSRDHRPSFQSMRFEDLTGHDGLWSAAMSPDGHRLAYCRQVQNGFNLMLRSIATERSLPLLEALPTPARALRFSRDGDYLYFVRPETGAGSTYASLFRIPAFGGEPRRLIFDVDSGIDLSPGGSTLAFIRGYPQRGESALVVAAADGSTERIVGVVKQPESYRPVTPAWSPDGRWIAVALYAPRADGGFSIALIDPSNGDRRSLGAGRWEEINGLTWNAAGSRLLLTAIGTDDDDRSQIWGVSFPDGTVGRVSNDLNVYRSLSRVSEPEGVLTLRFELRANLWSLDLAEQRPRRQWTDGSRPRDRIWHVQGGPEDSVLYSKRNGNRYRIWRLDAPGAAPRDLLPREAKGARYFDVSPDGATITFTAIGDDGRLHIYSIGSGGGAPVQVTDGSGEKLPCACPGNGGIFFSRIEEDGIWRAGTDGAPPEKVSDLQPYTIAPRCSPDGTRLAFDATFPRGDRLERTLVVLPLDGSGPSHQFPWLDGRLLQWAPDGESLTFVKRDGSADSLLRLPLDTGTVEPVTLLPEGEIFSYDWGRDGRTLYLSRGGIETGAVLLRDPA